VKEDTPIRLIRACTEDTGILTSLLGWFDTEIESVRDQFVDAKDHEIYKLQGEMRCMRRLRIKIATMTKAKGQVDEQPRIRSVR
jgi:hypothetical protein